MSPCFCFVANRKYSSILMLHGGPHAVVWMETMPAVLGQGPEQPAELTHYLDPPISQCMHVFDLWKEAGVRAENSTYRHLQRQQAKIHIEKPQVFFTLLSCIINDTLMGDE